MHQKSRQDFHACVVALGATLAIALPAQAQAQEFPTKPVRLVVGFPPGGTMDIYARVLAKALQERSKFAMIIDNRPGAGGIVAASQVLKSDADGYTLIHLAPSTLSRVFVKEPPFDVYKDLPPVSSFWLGPFVLTAGASVPSTTIRDFVDLAKANPGKLNYGVTSPVSGLPMALFANIAGIKLQRIEYKANTQMNSALLTEELQATFTQFTAVQALMNSGKVRVLMVTGNQRIPALPNVPTTTEAGYPGVQAHVVGAIFAPPGVPAPILNRLSAAIKDSVASPEVEKIVANNGARSMAVSNDDLMRTLREEDAMWANTAKITGYRPE